MTDTTDKLSLQQLKDVRELCLPHTAWRSIIDELISARDQLEAERQRADKANRTCSDLLRTATDEAMRANKAEAEIAELKGDQVPVALTVWYGSMPESNGKENWTAILHRKGVCISEGITVDRSEYPERVRYAADCMRYLIGEIQDEPDILAYDAGKRSDYVYPVTAQQKPVVLDLNYFDEHFDRLLDEKDDDIEIGQLGARNYEALHIAIHQSIKAAIKAAGGIVKEAE